MSIFDSAKACSPETWGVWSMGVHSWVEPCSGLQGVDTCPLGSTLFSPIEYGTATLVDRCFPVSPIPAPCVQQLSCFLEEPGVKGTHVSALKIALTAVGSRLLVTRMAPVLGLGQVSPGHCSTRVRASPHSNWEWRLSCRWESWEEVQELTCARDGFAWLSFTWG